MIESTLALRPQRTLITGNIISLAPLNPTIHGDSLHRHINQDELWVYLPWGPFPERAAFDNFLHKSTTSDDPLYFSIIENATGQAKGCAAYMRIEPVHRVIEVGSIIFAPSFQRTIGSTEVMYLMARYVFEELGYRRYEWKCNAANDPSRAAAQRLGFTFEGIFRQHMIVKGRNRDTAWFSMLDSEWPSCKAAFEAWLDPSNFDSRGQQKRSLRDVVGLFHH